MKHDFYQFIIPAQKLIKVGCENVPDDKLSWKIPIVQPVSCKIGAFDFNITPDSPIMEEIEYKKCSIGFIAVVDAKLKRKI